MSLDKYLEKRNFFKSPEPKGKRKNLKKKKLLYVIQKHNASHLHYDLRLEMQGVLKSWAVPKQPSKDPNVKRLAIHVEDHPIEYGSFEGIIPKGHYGAGTVKLWDKGEWECLDDDAIKAYRKGSLSVLLKGKKLAGEWKLVQIKSDPKHWLFMKVKDKYIESESENFADYIYKNARKSDVPAKIKPQLATFVNKPPDSNEWLHEIKFDGYRIITIVKNKTIIFLTRNQLDWTTKFTALKQAIKTLNLKNTILDGELVAINDKNKIDFQLLQQSIKNNDQSNLVYYVFDIPYYNGYDLKSIPLVERKKIIEKMISHNHTLIQYSDHIIGNGVDMFKKSCDLHLEGIISKKIDSHYIQKRSKLWLKSKCTNRQEFVIVGYTKPQKSRRYFGALLVAFYDSNKKLQYCGKVGTGFSDDSLKNIFDRLEKIKIKNSPLKKDFPIKNVHWVKPLIIIEVEFRAWTSDNQLRQASYKGIRFDKNPKEIKKEKIEMIKNSSFEDKEKAVHGISLTHPDKILYPKQDVKKIDIINFYQHIKKWILPYIINRPLSLLRCPNGEGAECFYQKHPEDFFSKHIYSIKVSGKKKFNNYLYIKDIQGLLQLVQLSVLEIHPWGSSVYNIEKPDVLIFDLDPAPDVEWKKVVDAARLLRKELKKLDLISFVKTTGGKGLHVVIPIKPKYSWEEIKTFSKVFVKYIVSQNPDLYIGEMSKHKRKGKIFIDYLRNQRGATAIAPYSLRAKENAPVATPLSWTELSSKVKSDHYTIKNLKQRLAKLKKDPWKGFLKLKQIIKQL